MADSYQTVAGDTWDIIAKKVYGSELRADWLMQNNAKQLDVFQFMGGITLKTPPIPEARSSALPPWR